MDFSVQGKSTPHSYQRHLPGGAKGQTAREKPKINPITGEEMCTLTLRNAQPSKEFKTENANGIPALNLNYLKDEDYRTGAIEIDLNDYSLDTPNSDSTVSWGTHRSGAAFRGAKTQMLKTTNSHRTVQRPDGVPELSLDNNKQESARKQANQSSAWDVNPVPGNLPQPSDKYKQMYQQYSTDLKQSYRDHVTTKQQGMDDAKVRPDSARQKQKGESDENTLKPSDSTFELSWTQKRYTEKQLLKKQDAEDLLEQNKRLKLVETVMIDQLSRAVISDPEQNDLHISKLSSSRKARGTNRHMHGPKFTTRATVTENLLSRRMRFGTRVNTHNGQDALRELTGFFFDFDQTLTVYEFRQFGKSAKAMPFIYRGQYIHTVGPKRGLPYSLSDIYTGANVNIPTKGQLTLPDSLAEKSHITLRVTDVDESERRALLAEKGRDELSHDPSKVEMDNREYLHLIQDHVQQQIFKRGVRVITGLGRYYRKLDHYKSGILDQYDLEQGLNAFHINLDMGQLEKVFDILDPEGSKLLDYREYMQGVIGEMSEFRKALVRKAFLKMDSSKKGHINVTDVNKFFNVYTDYKLSAGRESHVSALQSFLDAVRENEKQEHILYLDFEEYYEGLSLGVANDESFVNVLCNTWNI